MSLAAAFEAHRGHLWGLCYRMTGVAADADELVQETFVRAVESPPDTDRSLRPWLSKVAVNLARDRLRRRQHAAYTGPWLPSPIELDPAVLQPFHDGRTTVEGRFGLKESASYAFLVALEALTPNQRAVLLLRDVFDLSGPETAELLELSHSNVKTTLHRARKAMEAYQPRGMGMLAKAHVVGVIGRFLAALSTGDAETVARLLTEDAVAISDGGGEVRAAGVVITGVMRIAKAQVYFGNTAEWTGRIASVNGMPGLIATRRMPVGGKEPDRAVILIEVRGARVAAIRTIVAPSKLTAITSR